MKKYDEITQPKKIYKKVFTKPACIAVEKGKVVTSIVVREKDKALIIEYAKAKNIEWAN